MPNLKNENTGGYANVTVKQSVDVAGKSIHLHIKNYIPESVDIADFNFLNSYE